MSDQMTAFPPSQACQPRSRNFATCLRRLWRTLWLPISLLVALAVLFAGTAMPADAAELRLMGAGGKFVGRYQLALVAPARAPDILRIDRLELAAGVFTGADDRRPFVSAGPVWALRTGDRNGFVEFGIAPTVLAGSSLDGRDLGGNFHFTSAVALGLRLGSNGDGRIALRIQHVSNAGLASTNPGMDMVGLQFDLFFDR